MQQSIAYDNRIELRASASSSRYHYAHSARMEHDCTRLREGPPTSGTVRQEKMNNTEISGSDSTFEVLEPLLLSTPVMQQAQGRSEQ